MKNTQRNFPLIWNLSYVLNHKEQLDEYKRGKQMASKVVGSKLADGLKSNLSAALAKKSAIKLPLNKEKTDTNQENEGKSDER